LYILFEGGLRSIDRQCCVVCVHAISATSSVDRGYGAIKSIFYAVTGNVIVIQYCETKIGHTLGRPYQTLTQAMPSLDVVEGLPHRMSTETCLAAARLITGVRRCEHITPALRQLYWLPVRRRVVFKISILTLSIIRWLAPLLCT